MSFRQEKSNSLVWLSAKKVITNKLDFPDLIEKFNDLQNWSTEKKHSLKLKHAISTFI